MNSAYANPTGILFNKDEGFGSTFEGDKMLPRSIASDGRRGVLVLHVLTHLLALAANIVSCYYLYDDFEQSQIQVAAIVACATHGIGILCLLALAASEIKQVAFVVTLAFVYTCLGCGLMASAVTAVFTFRSDDRLTTPHWLYYTTCALQAFGISMLTACSLNMAAHGDLAVEKAA